MHFLSVASQIGFPISVCNCAGRHRDRQGLEREYTAEDNTCYAK